MFTPIQDLFLTKVEKIYRIEYKEDLPKDWVDKLDLRIIQISKRYLFKFFPYLFSSVSRSRIHHLFLVTLLCVCFTIQICHNQVENENNDMNCCLMFSYIYGLKHLKLVEPSARIYRYNFYFIFYLYNKSLYLCVYT